MKAGLAALMAALLVNAAAAGAADCPAALDFYPRPLLGDQSVHLCEEFGGRVVASFPSEVSPQDERLIAAIEALL
jgi:hypothetical protein